MIVTVVSARAQKQSREQYQARGHATGFFVLTPVHFLECPALKLLEDKGHKVFIDNDLALAFSSTSLF